MWNRLKALWGGSSPTLDDAEGGSTTDSGRPGDEGGRPATAASTALAGVQQSLEEGDAGLALSRLRGVLLDSRLGRAELECAARVMAQAEEPDLAELFQAASRSQSPEPAARLAAAFLEMDDAPVAHALATLAGSRSRADDPLTAGLLAAASARLGDHDAVVEQLAPWRGRWPEDALLGRYALSAVLSGRWDAWSSVSADVDASEDLHWMAAAATRAQSFPAAVGESPLRRALFVEYGAVLLDASGVTGPGEVGAARLARMLQRARDVLRAASVRPERISYISRQGELVADWLARFLDSTAMPLGSRIRDQRVVAVAIDSDEAAALVEHRGFDDGPTLLLQVFREPGRAGGHAPDLIGMLAEGASLPLGGLEAALAADRVPPRLRVAELEREAKASPLPTDDSDPWSDSSGWAQARGVHLAIASPLSLDARVPWLGDLPAWAFDAPREAEPQLVEPESAPTAEAEPAEGDEDWDDLEDEASVDGENHEPAS